MIKDIEYDCVLDYLFVIVSDAYDSTTAERRLEELNGQGKM